MVEKQSVTIFLRQHLSEQLGPNFSTIDQFSAEMGMSTKKLQRLLSEEGTSFSKALNEYRANQATELLGQTGLPLNIIASKLGYSSGEAFNTACKRWYKLSPRNLRYKLTKKTDA